MLRIRGTRISGFVACLLIVVLQLGPVTQVMAAKALPVPDQKIVIFPFSVADTVTQPNLGTDVGRLLTQVLSSTPGFYVSDYFKRHASLQRAALEGGSLTEKDLANPAGIGNRELAAKIARVMGYDMALIGDVESYKYDPAANTCEIMITSQLVDAKSGKILKTPVVTGLVPKTAKVTSEADCANVAAGDAVSKIAEGLDLKPSAAQQMVMPKYGTGEPRKKSKKSNLLLSLLLGLGVGFAVSGSGNSSSGGGGGGGIDPPPPPPQ
jgi:hypothetical protein